MQIVATEIPEVLRITPKRFSDSRGYFTETYNRRALANAGIAIEFVQDNLSMSDDIGTVRGLHFQSPPFAQDKLVSVMVGRVLDVAVDIRIDSPTFGKHVAVELSAENGHQLLVPAGFAHGFCVLEARTFVTYKVSAPYAPAHDHGIVWNDPDLGIDWCVDDHAAHLSDKDIAHPRLRDIESPFRAG